VRYYICNMHKKTFNIASLCLVALIIAFTITRKDTKNTGYTDNIGVNGEVIDKNTEKTAAELYQEEVLKTILDQSIKSFETTSESFKRKPTDTLSETIAKNTFSEYLKYNTTETFDINNIQAETIKALKEHPVERSSIGIQDILIIPNSVANLKKYANDISIIQTTVVKNVSKTRTKENPQFYIKAIYSKASDLYKKVKVPESLLSQHLGIINGYKDYSTGFQLLELQDTDPAKALGGVQVSKEAQDMLLASFGSIKKIVLLNKISFTKEEPAYIWFLDEAGTETIKLN
jgi:hypothetical protein